ncbi:MAG: large repetitive protein, partial [Gaiellales bacterium]|nr:large repetitive protein [Gaiellales bacterium]
MNLRRATRRSRLKLAAVALAVTLAAVAALVIPGLAGAVDVPSITSPSDGDFLNGGWNQTVSFSSATSPAVGFSLLRNPATGGSCDMTGASTVGSAAPNATSIHDDSSPLPDARYCYVVEADDGGGVVADSAPINITYDTGPPIATIGTTPSAHSSDTTPTFSFSSSESTGATFECSTDGGTYAACSSPKTLGSLSDGPHTFAVKAIDQAGNHSSSPDSFAWNVDTVHPTATIGTKPTSPSSDKTPGFSFSSSEPSGATFECSLDSPTYSSCSSPVTLPTLADGSHTFNVKAIDQAGNHSSSPASYTWIVDAAPPTATITTEPTLVTNDATPTFAFTSS